MPRYDYICTTCGHRVEVIHRIDEHGPRFCPECGAEGTMRKGIVTTAVHFKGSGWAKKDRASAGRRAASRSSSDDSRDGGGATKDGSGEAPAAGSAEKPATPASSPSTEAGAKATDRPRSRTSATSGVSKSSGDGGGD